MYMLPMRALGLVSLLLVACGVASNLPVGTYYVQVQATAATNNYLLRLAVQ